MSGPAQPWQPGEAPVDADARRHAPATLRNREPILAVLRDHLPASGTVLEIASGSGEHAVWFADQLPDLVWQPSDPDPAALASINAWRSDVMHGSVLPPLLLDASAPAADWPLNGADAILCCNMTHIAPWQATVGLMAGAGRLLSAGAPLILYGPFLEAGIETAPSNLEFDQSLKARNPEWGLRQTQDVDRLARANGLDRAARLAMPANNIVLLYRKSPG
ncbi:DUF938 domain-containing protein [Sphingomonas lacunae]|uniref:DUF938 domain-containing protein n=1 Tax=Sphingomonas lacunae TaxID=2698828 RepID=A0A6M4AY50_9SPHN|nr:DUF938 domain-containing protein [Sphingomonas lacunae]QJQ33290.1 DUF938 domain-containing protein [Sphingomonas lacunae]